MEIALDIINTMTICIFYPATDVMANNILQTIDGDSSVPDDFSFLSPPTSTHPLPAPSPALVPEQTISSMTFQPEESLPISLPSILLHGSPFHPQQDNVSPQLPTPIYYQPMDEDSMIDDPTTYDCTESSMCEYSEYSAYDTNQSGSGLSIHLPPSSGVSSGISSVVTSDSDLPPPKPYKSSKQVNQTGLHNFFSVIPQGEAHAVWSEKKRKNRDRDEEEQIEIMRQEKEWKQEKLQVQQEQNRLSQRTRRKKIKIQEI
jgi:hypothetical protein